MLSINKSTLLFKPITTSNLPQIIIMLLLSTWWEKWLPLLSTLITRMSICIMEIPLTQPRLLWARLLKVKFQLLNPWLLTSIIKTWLRLTTNWSRNMLSSLVVWHFRRLIANLSYSLLRRERIENAIIIVSATEWELVKRINVRLNTLKTLVKCSKSIYWRRPNKPS